MLTQAGTHGLYPCNSAASVNQAIETGRKDVAALRQMTATKQLQTQVLLAKAAALRIEMGDIASQTSFVEKLKSPIESVVRTRVDESRVQVTAAVNFRDEIFETLESCSEIQELVQGSRPEHWQAYDSWADIGLASP